MVIEIKLDSGWSVAKLVISLESFYIVWSTPSKRLWEVLERETCQDQSKSIRFSEFLVTTYESDSRGVTGLENGSITFWKPSRCLHDTSGHARVYDMAIAIVRKIPRAGS